MLGEEDIRRAERGPLLIAAAPEGLPSCQLRVFPYQEAEGWFLWKWRPEGFGGRLSKGQCDSYSNLLSHSPLLADVSHCPSSFSSSSSHSDLGVDTFQVPSLHWAKVRLPQG